MADEAETPAVVETAPKKNAVKKPTAADMEFPNTAYRIQASPKVVGALFDPDRNIRISRVRDVAVTGPIPEGSWLYCQIKAGLIDFLNASV